MGVLLLAGERRRRGEGAGKTRLQEGSASSSVCASHSPQGVGGSGRSLSGEDARSAHHVLFPLVQPHLAEGEAAQEDVDGGGDEAVVGDLLVQAVQLGGRLGAGGEKTGLMGGAAAITRSGGANEETLTHQTDLSR